MKIEGLEGDYCNDCIDSLCRYKLEPGSIVPMCREDLDKFLRNGDYERVSAFVKKGS